MNGKNIYISKDDKNFCSDCLYLITLISMEETLPKFTITVKNVADYKRMINKLMVTKPYSMSVKEGET